MGALTPCGGVIARDADGGFVKRYACEVHLFEPGICPWQRAMLDEREERRRDLAAHQ